MNDNERKYYDALIQISDVASAALGGHEPEDIGSDDGEGSAGTYEGANYGCSVRTLPRRLWGQAAKTAAAVNPLNAPAPGVLASMAPGVTLDPARIAVLTSRYWGPRPRRLTVSFMENTPADLRARIISHLNAWNTSVSFVWTRSSGQVRISRGPGGYYSYVGTDILHIPQHVQTLNLEGFTMNTSEREFRRVARHEGGHTLGFPHEHMRAQLVARIDRQKAYDYFRRTQGWTPDEVDQQVLTALDERSIMGTPPDQTSIMCYQLPGSITRDGRAILGGTDINVTDRDFARRIYPRTDGTTAQVDSRGDEIEAAQAHAHDGQQAGAPAWDESEDVEVDLTA